MARFLLTRLALALVTLFLLSILVFAAAEIFPGNVAGTILGPTADARAIAALNAELGLNEPALTRYLDFIGGFLRGDLGQSYTLRTPVGPVLLAAMLNSLKLAAVALLIVVPLAIAGGIFAALRQGTFIDRAITGLGLAAMVVPEFVSGIVVLLVFAVWLDLLPVTATAPAGSGILTQLQYLILPTIPLIFVLFGYIARVTRAGAVEVLNSDYVRTAALKGLPRRTIIRRHVLRNALPPTVTVVATQVGYLFGGLVVIEILFNYRGIGLLIFNAARSKDFPLLESCVLVIGILYLTVTLLADVIYSLLNPRIRLGSST